MRRTVPYLLALVPLVACKPPPPAPEGLDASTSYVIRNFYADDALFQAGVQGFVDWYDTEGFELVGQSATTSNTDSFTIADLSIDDLGHLPMDAEIVVDGGSGETGARDLTRAKGVVSLAEMQCPWTDAEKWLARSDQNNIFPDDFEGYERTYLTTRATYEDATAALEFDAVDATIDPFADGYDGGEYARTVMQTENMVDPTAVLVADIEAYPMHLDFRHGSYTLTDGEEVGAFAILTWIEAAAWGSSGDSGLLQSYSIEINVGLTPDTTLRMLAVWTEPKGGGIEPDSAMALNFAVNKSLKASERLSAVCAGEEEVPAEP